MSRTCRFSVILGLVALAATAFAANSGPYRGPQNNGIYEATGLRQSWPPDGPPLQWKANIGEGYGGVTVVDDTVYIPGGTGASLFAFTLDGQEKARIGFGSTSWARFSGTKSTPLIRDGIAIVTKPNADIIALDLKTGEQKWSLNAWTKFGSTSKAMGWGYPSTPSIYENKVILNPVSRADTVPPVVAVDFATGETIWQADAGTGKKYSCGDHSASVIIHNGHPLSLNPTWRYLLCLDPRDGKKLWEIGDPETEKDGVKTINGSEKSMTPVYNEGYVLFDRAGWATCIKLNEDGTAYTPLWARPYGQNFAHAVIMGKRLYMSGDISAMLWQGEDALKLPGPGTMQKPRLGKGVVLPPFPDGMVCLDAETGEIIDVLRMSGGLGHVISAEGMLYAINKPRSPESQRSKTPEEAKLGLDVYLLKPTEQGIDIAGQFHQAMTIEDAKQVRELEYQANVNPVVAAGRLFLRYGPLWVYDLRPGAAPAAQPAPAPAPTTGLWDLRLKGFCEQDRELWVTIQMKDGTPVAGVAAAPRWNRAIHTVDVTNVKLADSVLCGTMAVTLNPDATIPTDKQPIVRTVTFTAKYADGRLTGEYTGGQAGGTRVEGRAWAQ